jgi:hypothetical protein
MPFDEWYQQSAPYIARGIGVGTRSPMITSKMITVGGYDGAVEIIIS